MDTARSLKASPCPVDALPMATGREWFLRSAWPTGVTLGLHNACLHLKDYFVTWYLFSLRRVELEGGPGMVSCINKASLLPCPGPSTY